MMTDPFRISAFMLWIGLLSTQASPIDSALVFHPFDSLTCADGSPFGIYVEENAHVPLEESTNHVIVLMGGGICAGPDDCRKDYRERPFVFSTKFNPSKIQGTTVLSSDAEENPSMYNHTKWMIPYCSQDFFLGDATRGQVGDFNHSGSDLFKHAISFWRDQIRDAKNGNSISAANNTHLDNVVVVGISAGAVGLMNQIPTVRAAVNELGTARLSVMLEAPSVLSDNGYKGKDFGKVLENYVNFDEFPLCDPSHPLSIQYEGASVLPCCLSTHCLIRHDRDGLASFALNDDATSNNTGTAPAEEQLLIVESAYDPVAMIGGTNFLQIDRNEDQTSGENINGQWQMVETAGNQKARAKETVAALEGFTFATKKESLGTRFKWIMTSCVTHSILVPTTEFLTVACDHSNYNLESFDFTCTPGGLANQYTTDIGLQIRIWRTINSWNQVMFGGQSIHEIIQGFVGGSDPSDGNFNGAVDLRLEKCSGPNCLSFDNTLLEQSSCQSLVEVENVFIAVPIPLQVGWVIFIGFMLCMSALLRRNPRITVELEREGKEALPPCSSTQPQTLVSLRGINAQTKDGKKQLLYSLGLTLQSGSVLGIAGRSGSGKTTLLKVLSKINQSNLAISVEEGQSKLHAISSSYLCQDDSLWGFGNLFPVDYLVTTAKIYGAEEDKVQHMLEFVRDLLGPKTAKPSESEVVDPDKNMNPFFKTRIVNLSGGQKKILSIAATLLRDPQLLLLDEPLGQLDGISSIQVMTALEQLAKTHNCCVVVTIHQPSKDILAYFDRMVILEAGVVVLNDQVEDPEGMAELINHVIGQHNMQRASAFNSADRLRRDDSDTDVSTVASTDTDSQIVQGSALDPTSMVRPLEHLRNTPDVLFATLARFQKLFQQVQALTQRIQRQNRGHEATECLTLMMALVLLASVLSFDSGSHKQALVVTSCMIAVPTFLFTHKIYAYNELWRSHKFEIDDCRISPLSFQLATIQFTFPIPLLGLSIAMASAYGILGWTFKTYLVQFLFAGVHLLVALQFGKILVISLRGDFNKVMKVYTTSLLISGIFSGLFISSYKFPDSLRFLFYSSTYFWALSGSFLNLLDDANNHFQTGQCHDFFSCLLSDGNVAGRALGFSALSNSSRALGVLTLLFCAMVLIEYTLLRYRTSNRNATAHACTTSNTWGQAQDIEDGVDRQDQEELPVPFRCSVKRRSAIFEDSVDRPDQEEQRVSLRCSLKRRSERRSAMFVDYSTISLAVSG